MNRVPAVDAADYNIMANPIIQTSFKGRMPRVAPKLLPEGFAQVATNCELKTGRLTPMAGLGELAAHSGVTVTSGRPTVFKNGSTWMKWSFDVDVVKAQISNSNGRVYLSSGDVPEMPHQTDLALYPSGGYRTLGLAAPSNILDVATKGDPAYGETAIGTITDAETTAGSDTILCPTAHGLTLEVGDIIKITDSTTEGDERTYSLTSFGGGDDVNGHLQINTALTGTATGVTVEIYRQKEAGTQATVSYVYTKVRTWPDGSQEESAPSDPSDVVDIANGQGVILSNFDSWAADSYLTLTFRIYRLAAGTTGAEYIYLAEIPCSQTEYNDYQSLGDDSYELLDVGSDALETTGWVPPPSDLEGLTQFSNGILIGFVGNKLYVSEPYVPYAWPDAYTMTFDHDIVALAVHNESIIVLTEAYPYVVTGLDPESMSQTILPYEQACVSKRGVVTTNVGVLFPSPDGLFLINGHSCTCVTEKVFTREQWAALSPENLESFFYNDMYYGFFYGTGTGIAFNFKENPYIVDIEISGASFLGGFLHAEEDVLYLINGGSVYPWGAGSDLEFTWKSRLIRTGEANNYACAAVVANDEVTFRLYADGELKHTETVTDEEMFRLPSGYRAREWEFALSGSNGIDSAAIGQFSGELF